MVRPESKADQKRKRQSSERARGGAYLILLWRIGDTERVTYVRGVVKSRFVRLRARVEFWIWLSDYTTVDGGNFVSDVFGECDDIFDKQR